MALARMVGGKMHIIAGQPGTGKTTIAMKMAAAVSAGGRWPDGSNAKQGNVVIWSGEDDPADTLIPRLEASGADLSRIFFAGEMMCGKERRVFDPAKDIPALQAAIEAAGGAGMIIIDPIVSATAADSHKNRPWVTADRGYGHETRRRIDRHYPFYKRQRRALAYRSGNGFGCVRCSCPCRDGCGSRTIRR
jgi:hypothetical protein